MTEVIQVKNVADEIINYVNEGNNFAKYIGEIRYLEGKESCRVVLHFISFIHEDLLSRPVYLEKSALRTNPKKVGLQ